MKRSDKKDELINSDVHVLYLYSGNCYQIILPTPALLGKRMNENKWQFQRYTTKS